MYFCILFGTHILGSLTNKGPVFYLKTNKSAPKHKIVAVDISGENNFEDVVPEADATLSDALCVNKDYLLLIYKKNVRKCPLHFIPTDPIFML